MDIFYDKISTEIENRLVQLYYAADIVRFSYVAQNSISPLDLAQQEEPNSFRRDGFWFSTPSVLDSTIQYPKYVINTEEKCRKILSRTRDFLYRLHLDLPRKRECSLKDGPEPINMDYNSRHRHIGKITVDPNFHFSVLSSLVKKAIKRSDKKLKMIKWLLTFDAVTEDVRLRNKHVNYFVNCMYPEVTESAFVKAFLKRFDLNLWMIRNERSEFAEFFLFHLRQNGGTLNDNKASHNKLIEMCIRSQSFLNIGPILKYQDSPRVPQRDTVWFTYIFQFQREAPRHEVLREAEKRMSPKRFYLMVQLLFIYYRSPTKPAAECLRLLWNSLSDAFFSFEEIQMALQGLSPEAIRDLYHFYSGAVGVFHERVEPRSLKHLSRPIVRRMLWDSGCWIPEGIKLIGVPIELQSFLNLEA